MANSQIPIAVFIVVLLGAHEVKGFSTVSNIKLIILLFIYVRNLN